MQNKIHTHENNGKIFLFIEVPEGSKWKLNLYPKSGNWLNRMDIDVFNSDKIKLPSGTYSEPLFAKDLNESEWSEIVKNNGLYCYDNYKGKPDEVYTYVYAKHSGYALLKSLSMKPENCLIIPKIS